MDWNQEHTGVKERRWLFYSLLMAKAKCLRDARLEVSHRIRSEQHSILDFISNYSLFIIHRSGNKSLEKKAMKCKTDLIEEIETQSLKDVEKQDANDLTITRAFRVFSKIAKKGGVEL